MKRAIWGLVVLLFFLGQVPGAFSKGKTSKARATTEKYQDEDSDRDLDDQDGPEENSRFKADEDDSYEEKIPEIKDGSKFQEEAEDIDKDTDSEDQDAP